MSSTHCNSNINPSRSFNLSLWNANGLKTTTIQDVLSHVSNSDLLFITETWLTSGYLPINWSQFHLYGTKVPGAFNRGSGGVSILVSPSCPFTVSQLPSSNPYTLSLKVDSITIHCIYFPPNLSNELVFSIFNSLLTAHDTIILGDFNARLGGLTGDSITNPRGTALKPWLEENDFRVLNATLAYGIPTFNAFRNDVELCSIIDLLLTNIPETSMPYSHMVVETELSLGSDHRLVYFSMEYISPVTNNEGTFTGGSSSGATMATRRLWNLSRLGEAGPRDLFQTKFKDLVTPLNETLNDLITNPPDTRPQIDSLNDSLNECLYTALDDSIGIKKPGTSHWRKKYWTTDIQAAASERERCYKHWRHATGVDKIHWWSLHQIAHKNFRKLVSAAKRLSWKNFCDRLEKDFTKATAAISKIKRSRNKSSTFAHPDGPQASVDSMSSHLASVFNGSLLGMADRPPAAPDFDGELPFSDLSYLDDVLSHDNIIAGIHKLPYRKAPGGDSIKAEMLKPISGFISTTLSLLFRLCFQWAYTPKLWRVAHVFPIFKKGDPSDPANYRPISLTSVVRKLFEFCISDQLYSDSPIIDVAQGGFRSQRSPMDQALCLHDLMHDYFLTNHRRPVVAFLDIKAAYDTVDRRVIWHSLNASGTFSRPLLGLLINMFDNVEISVLIANHISNPFTPVTGVLQGSVLSPHLYSIYINSLPKMLRSIASTGATKVTLPDDPYPTAINCLLFADDVAIFGSHAHVQNLLHLAGAHSIDLGYRWSPKKCAVIKPVSDADDLTLYGESIPTVEEFVYLGVPFREKGLHGPGILELRKGNAIKSMALLKSVGVHRNGFSLLLCARLYKTFIRPKFEYGFAISRFSSPDLTAIDRLQNRLVGMFVGSKWFNVAQHITGIPAMKHRYNILATRFALRAQYLPDDCLLVLLSNSLRYPRLKKLLENNEYYKALPDPVPVAEQQLRFFFQRQYQAFFDREMEKAARTGKYVLVRACRSDTFSPDPILYLPISKIARSRLVRWRLGRFTNFDELCTCLSGERISRDHFRYCDSVDSALIHELPEAPPFVNFIDHAINSLPNSSRSEAPAYWPALLALLYQIDCLCRPGFSMDSEPDPLPGQWMPTENILT